MDSLDEGMIMKKILFAALFAFILPASLWGKPPAFSPERTVTLVFSSSIHGEVEPCG
jgi:hypothetical protein